MLSCFSLRTLLFSIVSFLPNIHYGISYLYSIHAKMRASCLFQETNPLKCFPTNEGKNPPFFFFSVFCLFAFFLPKSKFIQRKYKQLQMQCIYQTKQASFKLGTNLSICKYSRIRILKIAFGSQALVHNSHSWKIILSFSCLPEKMSTGLKDHAFYIPSISQVLWNGEPFMFLFVLNSDSFVSSSMQITRVRQKQARLRRVGLGGRAWGTSCHSTHSRSLKNFHTLCIPPCPPQIPVFSNSICCGIYHTPVDHWALARLFQRRCIPLDCTKHRWENGWQFQNLVTIARMSTSHIQTPFPPQKKEKKKFLQIVLLRNPEQDFNLHILG